MNTKTLSPPKRRTSTFDKVLRLPQHEEAWEGTSRIARLWIVPRNKAPYRPYMIMFVSAEKGVLRTELVDSPPAPARLFDELLNAMHRPHLGAGPARRPSIVYLDNAEHVAALSPRLAELNVRCEFRRVLPALNLMFDEIQKGINGREPPPGLLSIAEVTPPIVAHLYQLAAEYFRLAPWRWLNDMHPIKICYPHGAPPRYAVVMGSGGEIFGLAVYDSLEDLRQAYMNLPLAQLYKSRTWLALYFDEAMAMSFDDLEAMEKYQWPIASEHAYPIFARTTRNGELTVPDKRDIFWLEGALAAILAYFAQRKKERRHVAEPAEVTLTIATISHEEKVDLLIPAIGEDELFEFKLGHKRR